MSDHSAGSWKETLEDLRASPQTRRDVALEMGFQRLDKDGAREQILEQLVERHANGLARLAWTASRLSSRVMEERDLVRVLGRVFERALRQRDHFYGQTSLFAWLRRLTLQETRSWLRWRRLIPVSGVASTPFTGDEASSQRPSTHPLSKIQNDRTLSPKDRLALMLRFVDGLSAAEVAFILEEPASRVRRRLDRGWQVVWDASEDQPEPPHTLVEDWLQQHRLGDLPDDAPGSGRVEAHLDNCEACARRFRHHLEQARGLGEWFSDHSRLLSQAQLLGLIDHLRFRANEGPSWRERWGLLLPRETGWILATLLAALAVGWRLARQSPQGGLPLYPPTPVPVDQARPGQVPLIDPLAPEEGSLVLNGAPSLSGDGRWLTFSSSDPSLVPGDDNGVSDVFLFDRQTEELSVISLTSAGTPADGWSDTPDISADGRWVAFTSPSRNLAGGDIQTCARPGWPNWEVTGNCVNIYLHNRESGMTTLITRGFDGSRVDGSSFQPTLSPDGRWLVFWSQASNLVPEDPELCGSVNCVDLFLFDRIAGEITRIFIGRDPNFAAGNESLSLSSDAGLLAFTLYASDRAADSLAMESTAEAAVFDLGRSELELVNVSSQGQVGDLGSSNPRLSADGRFVAFASRATNLVPDDSNQRTDVFVRDLQAGTTERVSVSSDGSQGNDHSGLSSFGLSIWGEEIGLSADARFVVFSSTATNLLGDEQSTCPPTSRICSNVLLHDRQTGETELVVADPRSNRRYFNPDISDDGRWIAFADQIFRCSTICGQIWMKDRQENVTLRVSEPEASAQRDYPRAVLQGTTPAWAPAAILSSGQGGIRGLAFSPDGALLAGGGDDEMVRIWRLGERAPVWTLGGHEDVITQLAFSPDGSLLASVSLDRSVRVWRIADGSLVAILDGFPGKVSSLAFSPDGTRMAVGTWRAVWFWRIDSESLELFEKLDFPGSDTHSLAYSPDGKLLAVAPGDNTVWLRHTLDGEFVLRLGGHEGRVKQVAFAPDGSALATASEDRMVNVWQLEERLDSSWHATPSVRLVHGEWVTSLAYSPDGAQLLTGSLDSYLRLWDVPAVNAVQTLARGRRDAILNLAISSSGQDLVVATINDLQLWRKVLDPAPDIPAPQFFRRAETDRFRMVEPLIPVHPIFEDPDALANPTTYDLAELSELAPFQVWTPTWLPPNIEFAYGTYDPLGGRQRVALVFRQKSAQHADYFPAALTIDLERTGSFAPVEVGASARVEAVQIGGGYAEYARGDWVSIQTSPLELIVPSMINTWIWESGSFSQRLRWETDGAVISLDYRVFEPLPGELNLSREDLLRIAEHLRPGG